MSNKKYVYTAIALAAMVLATAGSVFADNTTSTTQYGGGNFGRMMGNNGNGENSGNKGQMMKFGVYGTVSAVSGNTITVSGKQGSGAAATPVVFTVDATNAKVVKNGVAGTIANILVGDKVVVQGTLNGTNVVATIIRDGVMMNNKEKQGISGLVSAVSGNTITVTSKKGNEKGNNNSVVTTFTVDATNSKVVKNGVAGTIAGILVGDTVMVQGTINGTNVVATMIRDGANNDQSNNGQIPPVTGNGQPVVVGTVSAVNGATLTITNKSNVSYTVDTTNAKITQGVNTISVSNIAVGDTVIVQGTFTGNTVAASSVIDQTKQANNGGEGDNGGSHGGFFGGIGSFFAHLFGF